MLYLFCGTDKEKARAKFREFIEKTRGELPGATYKEFDEESFSPSAIEELLAARGLFEETILSSFNNFLKNPDAAEFLKRHARALAESKNIFAFYEDDTRKTALVPLEKHAEKVWRFDSAPIKKSPTVFAFAEAFARGDKKNAWILLQKARSEEIPPEQIFGALFWQIKTMAIVKNIQNDLLKSDFNRSNGDAALSSMNPYTREKALRLARGAKTEDLHHLLGEIVDAYHGRETGADPDIALERLVLR